MIINIADSEAHIARLEESEIVQFGKELAPQSRQDNPFMVLYFLMLRVLARRTFYC